MPQRKSRLDKVTSLLGELNQFRREAAAFLRRADLPRCPLHIATILETSHSKLRGPFDPVWQTLASNSWGTVWSTSVRCGHERGTCGSAPAAFGVARRRIGWLGCPVRFRRQQPAGAVSRDIAILQSRRPHDVPPRLRKLRLRRGALIDLLGRYPAPRRIGGGAADHAAPGSGRCARCGTPPTSLRSEHWPSRRTVNSAGSPEPLEVLDARPKPAPPAQRPPRPQRWRFAGYDLVVERARHSGDSVV